MSPCALYQLLYHCGAGYSEAFWQTSLALAKVFLWDAVVQLNLKMSNGGEGKVCNSLGIRFCSSLLVSCWTAPPDQTMKAQSALFCLSMNAPCCLESHDSLDDTLRRPPKNCAWNICCCLLLQSYYSRSKRSERSLRFWRGHSKDPLAETALHPHLRSVTRLEKPMAREEKVTLWKSSIVWSVVRWQQERSFLPFLTGYFPLVFSVNSRKREDGKIQAFIHILSLSLSLSLSI